MCAAAAEPHPPTAMPRTVIVALLGNPNTGKTTLFNALAGMRQRVGNYPGVTVEVKKARLRGVGSDAQLLDLPGTYSLAARSPDEMVAVDLVLGLLPGERRPDVLVSVVDASNIDRNLYLTTQALELGVPVVVALNMVDVAERHGTRIDAEVLAKHLGVPVVPIQANKGKGLEELVHAIAGAANRPAREAVAFPSAVDKEQRALAASIGGDMSAFLARRILFDVGGQAERRLLERHGAGAVEDLHKARARLAEAGCRVPEVEAKSRYAWIREATRAAVRRSGRPVAWTDRLDRVLTHRVWGTVAFLAVMFLVFESIFTWARPLMDAIDGGREAVGEIARAHMPAGPLRSLAVDGVLKGVGSVVVFVPQIVILFGFIAVLEDCGYMARAAFLMDRLMARCGLSGKSFIPLLSSFACAVPGVMAARVIEDRRDRLATILVAPLMSCSARLPVYALLIGAFLTDGFAWWVPGLTLFAMYLIGLVVAPLVALALKRTLLRGQTPVFVMEMPVYKIPSLGTVVRRMTDAGGAFLRRAGTLILASMVIVWALLYFPATDADGRSYEERVSQLEERQASATGADAEALRAEADRLQAEWKAGSYLGRAGKALEPVVRPLGWDWRVGMAALASFPAREVVVGTLGIIYSSGRVDADAMQNPDDEEAAARAGRLRAALSEATWDHEPARKVFTVPVALSLMVFFALCCQCASTLAVIRRETNSWRWPAFAFTYMTLLAYVGALVVNQAGRLLGG